MLHGLQDNANSFDYLVCKLPSRYYYLCLDLPGHGYSNHLPSFGLPLLGLDYMYVIKLIVDYLNREKYIIIGHSFGAILGMQFGLLYPEKLEQVFILDTLWFEIAPPSEYGSFIRKKFEEFTKISHQMGRTAHTTVSYEDCIYMMNAFRYKDFELSPTSIQNLLDRSIIPIGNDRYKFTRDPKLKNYLTYPLDETYAAEVIASHNFNFKVIVIATKQYEEEILKYYPKLEESFRKIGDWISVNGTHNVHMDNPEIVADIINSYIGNSETV